MKNKYLLMLVLLVTSLTACNEPEPAQTDPLVRTHSYQGVEFSVRVKEMPRPNPVRVKPVSMETGQTAALTFELRISPAQVESRDVMLQGVANLEEYQTRMTTLNFHLDEALSLRIGDQDLRPKLVHMENTYGLTNYRMVQIVFVGPDLDQLIREESALDLVFRDPAFGTGISHFVFETKAIATAFESTPEQTLEL